MPAAAKKKLDFPVPGMKTAAIPKAKKTDKELQERLKTFIGEVLEEMVESFKDLSPTKKWDLIIQLLPYATPKMQATDITNNGGDFDPLDTQLGRLANSLTPKE